MPSELPRVAILRGLGLNPHELETYRPLLGGYDIFAVGAHRAAATPAGSGTVQDAPAGSGEQRHVDLPVVRLRTRGSGRVSRRLLGDWGDGLLGLGRALAGSAIVHAAETFTPTSAQAAAARRRLGFKLVLTCWENIPFLHDDEPRVRERKRLVREATDLFLPVTEAARDALLLEGVSPDRVVVQPMGVDRDVFCPRGPDRSERGRWELSEGWRAVLYCGRLLREKGLVDLVRALPSLPRTVLVLAGVGPERGRLETAAAALGVADRLRFLGAVEYGRIAHLYAAADAFCLPSVPTPYWQEQFGMVLVEALACGVPVVTTRTGSIPEVVGDAALLVRPYAPDELAAALARALDDEALRAELAAAGPRRVAERYDARTVAASIGAAYAELLDAWAGP